jgi:cell division protein FtsQ
MPRDTRKMKPVRPTGIRWRLWGGLLLLGVAGVSTAMAALRVRHVALTDPQFKLSRGHQDSLTLQGIKYASRWKVQRVFASDFEHSIFSVPLAERRRRLLAIDWVEDATVSRLWPDRLVVHIRERRPVAFVYFRSGVLLIDAYGVLLDLPGPKGAPVQFAFPVLSGVREDETEQQRRERVGCLLRMQEELGPLAKDISELNAADPENLRMVAHVENRAIELIMGDGNFSRRYQNFINHYPEIKRRSPEVKAFDLRLDDRITTKD